MIYIIISMLALCGKWARGEVEVESPRVPELGAGGFRRGAIDGLQQG